MFLGNWLARWLALSAMPSSTPVPPRAKLPAKKSGYWVPIARGFALGYSKGPTGSAVGVVGEIGEHRLGPGEGAAWHRRTSSSS
jgi:hypothetical protein